MSKIKDMTLRDLEQLIEEKILEASQDPDQDLEVRADVEDSLRDRQKERSSVSHDEIVDQYG